MISLSIEPNRSVAHSAGTCRYSSTIALSTPRKALRMALRASLRHARSTLTDALALVSHTCWRSLWVTRIHDWDIHTQRQAVSLLMG